MAPESTSGSGLISLCQTSNFFHAGKSHISELWCAGDKVKAFTEQLLSENAQFVYRQITRCGCERARLPPVPAIPGAGLTPSAGRERRRLD